MIGDRLYTLTPRDSQVTPLDVFYARETSSLASAGPFVDIQSPVNSVALITTIFSEANAGAAQTAQILIVQVLDPQTQAVANVFVLRNGTGLNLNSGALLPSPLFLFPGFRVRAQGVFSGAIAANSVSLEASGVLIPRGNMSLGSLIVTKG